jgi:hypothetical protein
MDNPQAIVSPGGVGFDINCGVRLIRTNLMEADVAPVKEQLAQALFDHIPVGVGSKAGGGTLRWSITLRGDAVSSSALRLCRASFQHLDLIWRRRWRWASTGAYGRDTHGRRTRSTARSTDDS